MEPLALDGEEEPLAAAAPPVKSKDKRWASKHSELANVFASIKVQLIVSWTD